MTRINGSDPFSGGEGLQAQTRRQEGERELAGGLRRFHTAGGGDDLHAGTGRREDAAAGGEGGERLRRFAESLKRADAKEAGDGESARGEPRLLALAEPGRPAVAEAATGPADTGAERRADAVAQTERIARMVEGALRAELSPVPGRPLTVSLKALRPGETTGAIAALSLTLRDGMLDVVLRRAEAGGADDALFLQAAQALAERLGARFPKRVVRILEDESAPRSTDEARERGGSVFDLFASRDPRS